MRHAYPKVPVSGQLQHLQRPERLQGERQRSRQPPGWQAQGDNARGALAAAGHPRPRAVGRLGAPGGDRLGHPGSPACRLVELQEGPPFCERSFSRRSQLAQAGGAQVRPGQRRGQVRVPRRRRRLERLGGGAGGGLRKQRGVLWGANRRLSHAPVGEQLALPVSLRVHRRGDQPGRHAASVAVAQRRLHRSLLAQSVQKRLQGAHALLPAVFLTVQAAADPAQP